MPVLLTRLLTRLSVRPFSKISALSVLLALAFFALPAATPAATINGTIRKLSDSTAIAGAKVVWIRSSGPRVDSTLTDSVGGYTLLNVTTGTRTVEASMSGFSLTTNTVTVSDNAATYTSNFYLGVPGSISGTVRRSTDSTILVNASVYLRRTSTTSAILDSTKTDSLGHYAFANKATGTPNYFVTVVASGYATTSNSDIVLNSGASVVSDVYVSPILPGSISGTVRKAADSTVVAGAKIYLRRTSTTAAIQDSTISNGSGAYSFTGLTAGTPNYFITFSAANLVTASNSNVVVNNGANTVSDIYLLGLGKIAAKVRRLSDSTNIANALVLLRRGTTDTSAILDSGRTDSLGALTFANLTASGGNNYRVYVSSAGFVSTSLTGLVVTNGTTTAANFYLGTPGSISGKVQKSTDSTVIAGASVYLRRTSTTNPVQDSVKTDSLGNYAFANLTPGTPNYFVTASAANFVTASNSNIVVGSGAAVVSNVYLTPVLPGSISGTVRKAADSTAVKLAKIYLRRTSTTAAIQDSTLSDSTGAYAFANLAAGTPNYFITFSAAGLVTASNSNVVVNNGANTVSNIYLAALGKITARVRKLSDSTNVANALVLLRRGNSDTSAVLDSGRTDTAGAYTFANLAASGGNNYRVYASAPGYVSVSNTGITVTNGATTTTNLYLGTPGSISGKVRKSTDSTAIAGASVYLRRTSTTNPVQDSVLTDSLGNYAFANLTPGTPNYFVTASATNFVTASNSNIVVASGAAVVSNVYLTPVLPGSISGNVRKAADSTAIAGAKIYLRRTSTTNPIQDSTLSDSVGHYAFANLTAGTPNYFVTFSAAGFATASNSNIAVGNGANVTSNIYLAALGKITARVRKLSDSTNIANALVLLRRGTSDTTAILDSGRTDTLGAVTFSNLAASTGGGGGGATQYRVYASAAGFINASNTGITVTNGATTTTNLYLGIPGSISGKVRKASDSTALANAAVYLRRSSATSAILDSAKTDSLGNYAFANVGSGTPNYWITASLATYVSSTNTNVAVASGAAVTSNFYLALVQPGSITGTVRKLPDSAFVANALVRLRRGSDTAAVMDSARTDSVGHYAFANLVAGTPNYWVSAAATGLNPGSNTNVAVPNGGSVTSNFVLSLPGSISGKIRGLPDSLALKGALVQLRRGGSTTAVVDSAKTDSLGNYAFTGLTLANNYRVTASLLGYTTASNTNINVTSGAALTSNLTLALAARGRIYGKVGIAGDSAIIINALVKLRYGSSTAAVTDSVRSDSSGRYSFSNLLTGVPGYWLTASASGFTPQSNDSVIVVANDSTRSDFALAIVVAVKGSPVAARQLFSATRIGNQWVIHLPASDRMRTFEMRDVRGVMIHRAIVPAGATQITVPAMGTQATQAGLVMRLE